jgi:hypothetical protein
MKISLVFFITAYSVVACNQHKESEQSVQDGFFGQTILNKKLEVFAPGIVSTGLNEGYITFSPNGRECYWSILFSDFVTIVTWKMGSGPNPKSLHLPVNIMMAGLLYNRMVRECSFIQRALLLIHLPELLQNSMCGTWIGLKMAGAIL